MSVDQTAQGSGGGGITKSSDPTTGDDVSGSVGWRPRRGLRSTVTWVVALDLLLVGFFALLSEGGLFVSVANLQNMALNASALTLLACGTAMLLGSGQFDVSLGANLILSSVVAAQVLTVITGSGSADFAGVHANVGWAIPVAVVAAVATGTLVGLVNGLIVEYLRVNAFIATLGMLGVAQGLAFLLANGTNIGNLPRSMQSEFGIATLFGIPYPAFIVVLVVVVLWFVQAKTRFGSRTLAIGSARSAALRAGIAVQRHQVLLFALAGLLAGVAGFLDLVRFNTTNIGGHQTDALAAIAAAVIGGAGLKGGRASIVGAVAGVALAVILQTGLVIIGLSSFYQLIAVGAILIVAVWFDERRRATS